MLTLLPVSYTHLDVYKRQLQYQAIVPPFAGATENEVKAELVAAGLPSDGKVWLRDGRTGDTFAQRISIGYMYILKLHHMVEDKICLLYTSRCV